ncbi:hypothetical protein EZV62_027402 [Acer yangbiense]|uniref:Translation elongation factor EFG/EF2 domain-containing protein n=1 Tax=Acer yangbiense TaxID=1000413 RepID=A0A5C7GTN7_9ROSI|nr:hypothetical protein EZV62_027402 [Acer yangbiense]
MKARPMEEHLAKAIDEGYIGSRVDPQLQVMSEKFDWDTDLGKQIWCFGPRNTSLNMVVNKCAGVSFLNETKGSVVAGFQDASLEGALAHEEMRGICFEICDVVLHENPIERTGRQIIPTTRRAIYVAQLTAKPMLMKPVYLVEFQALQEALNTISSLFDDNRGKVLNSGMLFDHWELMSFDPLEPGSQGAQLLANMRKRKGLTEHMVPLSKYEDGDKDKL